MKFYLFECLMVMNFVVFCKGGKLFAKPEICRSHPCVPYKHIKQAQKDGCEFRKYNFEAHKVAFTHMEMKTIDPVADLQRAYNRLMTYINGKNAKNKKVKMGYPILSTHCNDSVSMAFYLAESNPPPSRNASEIMVQPLNLNDMYVCPLTGTFDEIVAHNEGCTETHSHTFMATYGKMTELDDIYNELWHYHDSPKFPKEEL